VHLFNQNAFFLSYVCMYRMYVCMDRPWCFIGKHNLEEAVKQLATERPDINVQISWKPFLLRPNMPEDGTPKV